MRKFIGLTGVKTSGKTTAFELLKEINPEIQEVTLAKRLKEACIEVLGVPRKNLYDLAFKEAELDDFVNFTQTNVEALIRYFGQEPDFEKHVRQHVGRVFPTGRKLAQYVGTEVLRNVEQDIHCIGATLDLPEEGVFVITDMRFESEFEYFRHNYLTDFLPVYIQRNDAEAQVDDHPSEKEVLLIAPNCYKIDNNGSFGDLKNQLLEFYNEYVVQADRTAVK